MLGVIYARYSSDKQQETSIEEQVERCTEYALKNKITLIHTYIDRGKSAHSNIEKRTEFLKMVDDSSSFDCLLIYKLDRFSRNDFDFAIYRKKLEDNNVRIISVTEELPNTPEGKLMSGFLQSYATYYSEVLSQRVTSGMYQNAKHLNVVTSVPFGYKSVNKKFTINEDEAPAIRLLFDLYAKDYSMVEILDILKDKGFKRRDGKDFVKSSFWRTLSNPIYIGTYKYKDIVVDDAVPSIVDKHTWNLVQQRLENEQIKKHNHNSVFLLSGKMYCECGRRMVGTSAKHGRYSYYTCQSCRINYVVKDVEQIVADSIRSSFTDEFCENLATMVFNMYKEQESNLDTKRLQSEYNDKIKQLERMKKLMLLDDSCYELYKNDIKPLQAEINRIKIKIDTKVSIPTYEECYEFVKEYQLYDTNDLELRKDLFNFFVYKIEMRGTSAKLYLNVAEKCSHKFTLVVQWGHNTNSYNFLGFSTI